MAIPKAAEIKCAALHEIIVQAFRGKVVGLKAFWVVAEMA